MTEPASLFGLSIVVILHTLPVSDGLFLTEEKKPLILRA